MAVIDLSQLPAPQIVDVPDFEMLLNERKAAFMALYCRRAGDGRAGDGSR